MSTAAAAQDDQPRSPVEVFVQLVKRRPGTPLPGLTELLKREIVDRRVTEASVRRMAEALIADQKLFRCAIPGKAPIYFSTAEEVSAAIRADLEARARAKSQKAEATATAFTNAHPHNDNANEVDESANEGFVLNHAIALRDAGVRIPLDFPVRNDADPETAAKENLIRAGVQYSIVRTPEGVIFCALPVRTEGGLYIGREYIKFDRGQLENVISCDLRLPRSRFSPLTINDKGNSVPKKQPQIMREISVLARGGWTYSSTIATSHVDADSVYRHKCWQPLPISPKFDPEFDGYLRTLGEEQYQILCDWFVHVMRTELPCVCLVLAGPNSAGKDLIPLAAAGLYTKDGTYGEGSLALDHFNPSIVSSPLAVCSEGLPVDFQGEPIKPNVLKQAISRQYHIINAKNQQPVKLFGNLRWVISANDGDFYKTSEHLIEQDAAAVVRRFVVLEMPQASADYLSRLGGMKYTLPLWITGERRAVRHVRWLVENHQIPEERADDRFGLKARAPELRRRLLTNSAAAGTIVAGIVGFLAGDPARRQLAPALRVGGGLVGVNVGKLAGLWRHLVAGGLAQARPPQERIVSTEVQRMAGGNSFTHDGLTFVPIDNSILIGHARGLGLSIDEIRSRIQGAVS